MDDAHIPDGTISLIQYRLEDGLDVAVRAWSHPGEAWERQRRDVDRLARQSFGNCVDPQFREAMVQAPLSPLPGVAPAYMVALLRFGQPWGLDLPVRFILVLPDAAFAAFGYDAFRLYDAGAFRFADQFQPLNTGCVLDPPTLRRPTAEEHPKPTSAGEPLATAHLAARQSVTLRAECPGADEWEVLRRVWSACGTAVRRTTALYSQNYVPWMDKSLPAFSCLYLSGTSVATAAAEWDRRRSRRIA